MAQQADNHGNLPPINSLTTTTTTTIMDGGGGVVEAPQERIKRLASYGNMIVVDANMPIKR